MLISLERDVTPYVIGREKVYERGSTLAARIWVTNDHPDAIDGAEVDGTRVRGLGEVVSKNNLHGGARGGLGRGGRPDLGDHHQQLAPGGYRVTMQVARPGGEILLEERDRPRGPVRVAGLPGSGFPPET